MWCVCVCVFHFHRQKIIECIYKIYVRCFHNNGKFVDESHPKVHQSNILFRIWKEFFNLINNIKHIIFTPWHWKCELENKK